MLAELEASWLQILDTTAYPRSSHWQACVAEIVAGDVIDAVQLGAPEPAAPEVARVREIVCGQYLLLAPARRKGGQPRVMAGDGDPMPTSR